MKKIFYYLLTTLVLFSPIQVLACSSFYLKHHYLPLHGANLDWNDGDGIIVINKKGFSKAAISDPKKHPNPLKWTSKYGSVTFNMFGCDWPWGGMNEAGLSCNSLLLKETKYSIPDSRRSIFLGQWLQYQLDNCATVSDVIATKSLLRIREINTKLRMHYFFCDRQGNSAIIEFTNGKITVFNQSSMPIKALTNDSYEFLVSVYKKFYNDKKQNLIINPNLSIMRFLRIADMLNKYETEISDSPLDMAFSILENVAYKLHRTTHTQWSMVFDSQNYRIWYMSKSHKTIKQIDLKLLDFSCSSPIMMRNIDMAVTTRGQEGFVKYTYQINRLMAEKAFKINPLKPKVSGERLERMAKYPETFVCQQ